jgi:ABC-type amino acid transport system permease subunit
VKNNEVTTLRIYAPFAFYVKIVEGMPIPSFTFSHTLMAGAARREAFDASSLVESTLPFFTLSSTLSLRHIFMDTRKNGFVVIIMCSILTMALAASDCEILNSGISSISTTCCTTNYHGNYYEIVCVEGRVTEM